MIRNLLKLCLLWVVAHPLHSQDTFQLNELGYFEKVGANIFVFNNDYNDYFGDSKISGVEFIHHGVRTVTNGDVRVNRTPEQWDPIPMIISKSVDQDKREVIVTLRYESFDFTYQLVVKPGTQGEIELSVVSDRPIPDVLVGKAALHMEFLPAIYSGSSFRADDQTGMFAHYPSGPMELIASKPEPLPLAQGKHFILAPESSKSNIEINSDRQLSLYDGRNQAQNGWFVLQSLLPANQTGTLVTWKIRIPTIPDWVRQPSIAHSQAGYHPDQRKLATVELDRNDQIDAVLELVAVDPANGEKSQTLEAKEWGFYKRYRYLQADFSVVTAEGIYYLQYGAVKTAPFLISRSVYQQVWQPTLDVFFPVQMDHMLVNEAYRVWHGRSHMDDARQAPTDYVHFDLYAQSPTTDSPFQPGEHISGLNVGGWYDAGDYDIRTQTQYSVILNLVRTWEQFRPERDQTYVDYEFKYVAMHHPDGTPDMIQQIYHGSLALMAQFETIGHSIPGIVAPDLGQYTHLGDGVTKTDNLIYNVASDKLGADGKTSAIPDDRWAFTNRTTSLTYGSVAALAAASRVLGEYDPNFASKCREVAIATWDEEQASEPSTFRFGNTTGGHPLDEEVKATVELLKTTGDSRYAKSLAARWKVLEERFEQNAGHFLSIHELLPKKLQDLVYQQTRELCEKRAAQPPANPFGVVITEGGWAGNGTIVDEGITRYWIHRRFPELMDREAVLASLNYLFGHHPDSDISFVSGVGSHTKKVAYGSNRADYSYIPGGIVPGVLILPPDFPENKENWPFLWGENEYVIGLGGSYLFLAMAAEELLNEE